MNMDKKLPRIFKNDINKEINNNRSVYYVNSEIENDSFYFSTRKEKSEDYVKDLDINEKISRIFKPGRHSFNVGVEIITTLKWYDTKIAGKIRDCFVTLDNDVIPLKDIIDIKIK